MSIAIRTKSLVPNAIVEPTEEADSSVHPSQHAEAPDAGFLRDEAPEGWNGRSRETDDAGEGRASLMEHQYTHGRSRS